MRKLSGRMGAAVFVLVTIVVAAFAVLGGRSERAARVEQFQLRPADVGRQSTPAYDGTTYLVKVDGKGSRARAAVASVDQAADDQGGEVTANLGSGWRTVTFPKKITQAAARELLAVQGVTDIEPNILFEKTGAGTTAPGFAEQWYHEQASDQDIDSAAAWAGSRFGSATVKVAVIDDGVDASHPDLAGRITAPYARSGLNATSPSDDHGTGVASLIAGTGAARMTGVAPRVMIVPARTDDGFYLALDEVVAGINHAIANNVQVINMSFSTRSFSSALYDAMRRANDAGILMVAAAGNDASNIDANPEYPASIDLPMVLAVGASTRTGTRAEFSNYGKADVDIAAPGTDMLVAGRAGEYYLVDGTSASAPVVAGLAALIKSTYPSASMYSIRQHILNTGVSSDAWSGYSVTGDIVNAGFAMATAPPAVTQPGVVTGGGSSSESAPVILTSPAPGETVDSWPFFKWEYSLDWVATNIQVEPGRTPDRSPLAATQYGESWGSSGRYSSSFFPEKQLSAGTYWWRVASIPYGASSTSYYRVSDHRVFTVPVALDGWLYSGKMNRGGSGKRVKAKLTVKTSQRSNDPTTTVQIRLLERGKEIWKSAPKLVRAGIGTTSDTTIVGTPTVSRSAQSYVVIAQWQSGGTKVSKRGTLYSAL